MMSYGGGDPSLPPYDLYTVTNLPPQTNYVTDLTWAWIYRTAEGQTNWTLFSVPFAQSIYLLADLQDTDGDGLTDAYEAKVSKSLKTNPDEDDDGLADGDDPDRSAAAVRPSLSTCPVPKCPLP